MGSRTSKIKVEKDTDPRPVPRDLHGLYAPSGLPFGAPEYSKGECVSDAAAVAKGTRVTLRKVAGPPLCMPSLLREIRVLSKLSNHGNVMRLYDVIVNERRLNVIMVYDHWDANLTQIFNTRQFFSELHVQYMLYEIISAVNYIHSAGVAHLKILPQNLFINEDCTIRLGGFAFARSVEDPKSKSKTKKIPMDRPTEAFMLYASPEALLTSKLACYFKAIDMWSVGCVFAELLQMMEMNCGDVQLRQPLFNRTMVAISNEEYLDALFDVIGTPPGSDVETFPDPRVRTHVMKQAVKTRMDVTAAWPACSANGVDMLFGMLQFDPIERLTSAEALAHPYLAIVRDRRTEVVYSRKGDRRHSSRKKTPTRVDDIPHPDTARKALIDLGFELTPKNSRQAIEIIKRERFGVTTAAEAEFLVEGFLRLSVRCEKRLIVHDVCQLITRFFVNIKSFD